jgi:hypothetical protein
MEEIKNINKKEKVKKTLTELSTEGWIPTNTSFASHLRIYQNGNERILYNSKDQTIEKRYEFTGSKQ